MPKSSNPKEKRPWREALLIAFTAFVIIGFRMGGFANGDDLTAWSDFEWLGIGLSTFSAVLILLWQHLSAKTHDNR